MSSSNAPVVSAGKLNSTRVQSVVTLNDLDNTRHISKLFSTTTDWVKHEITFPADTTGAFDDDNAASLNLTFWLHAGSTYSSGTLNTASFASRTDANRAAGVAVSTVALTTTSSSQVFS